MTIPITRPCFGQEELIAIQKPLERGWVLQGPFVREFEERFAAFSGARFAIATTSCTAALHIAVASQGLKPAQEVIVPAFTWISTPNVVEYMGAKPVFCDIDLDTFNIDSSAARALITSRTTGIIPVHLFGLCAEMETICEIAGKQGIWVIEDAACALGASYRGRHAGTFGTAGCFSFHPRKSITTGEGGMITTQQEDIDGLARSLRDHGASQSHPKSEDAASLLPEFPRLGFNYRMTDIQGALGCAQLQRAAWILGERARRAKLYDELLTDVPWLRPPITPDGHVHAYQAYVCLFCPDAPSAQNIERLHGQRNHVMKELTARGIATRPGTHAPPTLDYYAKKYSLRPEQFPNACLAERLTITLPLYPDMTDAEQATVCSTLREIMDRSRTGSRQ